MQAFLTALFGLLFFVATPMLRSRANKGFFNPGETTMNAHRVRRLRGDDNRNFELHQACTVQVGVFGLWSNHYTHHRLAWDRNVCVKPAFLLQSSWICFFDQEVSSPGILHDRHRSVLLFCDDFIFKLNKWEVKRKVVRESLWFSLHSIDR